MLSLLSLPDYYTISLQEVLPGNHVTAGNKEQRQGQQNQDNNLAHYRHVHHDDDLEIAMNVDTSDNVAAPTVQEQTVGNAANDFSATTPAPEGTVNTPLTLINRTKATNHDSDTAESAPPTPPPASSPEASADSSETAVAPAATVTTEVETGDETKAADASPHHPEAAMDEDAAEWVIVREETAAATTANGEVVNGTASSVEQLSTRGENVEEQAAAAAVDTGADQIVPGEFQIV